MGVGKGDGRDAMQGENLHERPGIAAISFGDRHQFVDAALDHRAIDALDPTADVAGESLRLCRFDEFQAPAAGYEKVIQIDRDSLCRKEYFQGNGCGKSGSVHAVLFGLDKIEVKQHSADQ